VVEAVHEEKTANDDPPDEERNVVDAGWHKPSSPFRERNHTIIDVVRRSTSLRRLFAPPNIPGYTTVTHSVPAPR
jgi:hypothetical protein